MGTKTTLSLGLDLGWDSAVDAVKAALPALLFQVGVKMEDLTPLTERFITDLKKAKQTFLIVAEGGELERA